MTAQRILSFLVLLITIIAFASCSSSPTSATDSDTVTDTDVTLIDEDETVDETVDETIDKTVDEAVDETVDETTDEAIDEAVDETVDEDIVINSPPEVLSVSPTHLSAIDKTDSIVIVFSETIDKTTFVLAGSSAVLSDSGVWSTTTVTDDTVTLTPITEWATGDTFLTADYADLLGAAGETLSLHYTVQVLFVNEGVGDSATGSMSDPMHSIQDALTAADTRWPADAEVHVMEGTYTLEGDNDIAPLEGISLYGGYESSNWSHRDSSLYTSLIPGSNTKDRVVFFGSNITAATVIDGFTILGGTNTGSVNIIGILCHESSPIIRHNIIQGGNTVGQAWGVYITDGAMPLVTENTIHGGTSEKTRGFYLALDAAPTITKNDIYGGDASNNSIGIYNSRNSHATITENTRIDGGTGDYSRGIMNTRTSSPVITNNPNIFGGKNKESVGIKNMDSATPIIQNNTINGGEGSDTRGIENSEDSEATIVGNTIVGGKGVTYTCGIVNMTAKPFIKQNIINGGDGTLYACGIANLDSSTPTINDNSVNGGSALQTSGIYNENVEAPDLTFFSRNTIEAGSGTIKSGGVAMKDSVVALSNNTIFGGSATNSYAIGADNSEAIVVNNTMDGGSGSNAHGIGCENSRMVVINNNIFTTTGLIGYGLFEDDENCTITNFSSNNIFNCPKALYHADAGNTDFTTIFSMENAMNSVIADSATDNISEQLALDSEYRFTGDIDTLDFDTAGENLSGIIDDDKDGNPRSGDGDVGYSIGAYEYD